MAKAKKYFGTDGIRGRVGEKKVSPDFILKLGWAVGKVINRSGASVLIGKDTRISGYLIESALEAGLSAAGVDISLVGPLPTPGIAYLTRTLRADIGIVISASHNPFYDNGIKFFDSQGWKINDEIEYEIEKYLGHDLVCVPSDQLGKAIRINDAQGRYIEFCKGSIPIDMRLDGLKIALDCANGATYDVAPSVFHELGAEVITIGNNPDGLNINEECGSTHPHQLQKLVLDAKADIGIALDGDGDRVILVDHRGEVVDGDEILYVLMSHLHDTNGLCGGVVGTVMTNYGLEVACKKLNVPFVRSKVGDRYVLSSLVGNGWKLGGESSGHIVNLAKTTSGDGIITALQVLEAMNSSGKSLVELRSGLDKMPQTLVNVRVKNPARANDCKPLQDAVKEIESKLSGKGRVLLRPSGTEPVVRVMVEGETEELVNEYAQILAEVVDQNLT